MNARAGDRKIHILLVDDNPVDVYLFRQALGTADLDCELTVLEDGAEAMALMRLQGKSADVPDFDLAVLDLNLPRNDGLEVLQALRCSTIFAQVPVAILSSSSSPREQAKLQQFGIRRYITKPSDLDEFLKIGMIVKDLLGEGDNLGLESS